MNVLYCGDSRGYAGMEASIYSLLTHTKNINIYVFSMTYERDEGDGLMRVFLGITEEQKKKLQKIVNYLDCKGSSITFIDTLDYYNTYFLNGVNENDGHSSPYAPLRLIVDIVLPYVPHILYLDCDTIIQEDLNSMYQYYLDKINTSEYSYAAFSNRFTDSEGKTFGYDMVAGVLLFDLNKCKQCKLLEKARYNITHNYYQWYDQSALQEAGKYVELPQTYNYMKKYEYRDYEPAILHFADELSPKVYFEPEAFYKKYPHLQYIKDGIKLLDTINF